MESVLAQSFRDFELIIVDDNSPDETPAVVASFADDRIRPYRNRENKGVPAVFNYAFSLARGRYLVIVEDHDILAPRYLGEIVRILEENPNCSMAATGIVTIDSEGRPLERYSEFRSGVHRGHRMLRRFLVRTTHPHTITAAIRRTALQQTGMPEPFEPRHWWYSDLNLWMRLVVVGDFGYVAEPLLQSRERENGHFLAGKDWEALRCVDAIHRENWPRLHPRPSVFGFSDGIAYGIARTYAVARLRVRKTLEFPRGWTDLDAVEVRRYLPVWGRMIVAGIGLFPVRSLRAARKLHRAFTHHRRRVVAS